MMTLFRKKKSPAKRMQENAEALLYFLEVQRDRVSELVDDYISSSDANVDANGQQDEAENERDG